MQLQLGWKAGTEQYPPEQLLEYAIVAEKAGFDSIDVSDHFHPWSERGQACFVWTWLGAATRVSRHRHRRGSQRIFGDGIVACLQNQTSANDRSDRIDPRLWSGEAVTHHGAYYETRKAKLYTRSEHAVPLYISAMGAKQRASRRQIR